MNLEHSGLPLPIQIILYAAYAISVPFIAGVLIGIVEAGGIWIFLSWLWRLGQSFCDGFIEGWRGQP